MVGRLGTARLREFGERGFVLVPDVVPRGLVDAASAAVDGLLRRWPPAPGTRGPHFYFEPAAQAPALLDPLRGSPAFGLAEELTGPGTLDAPDQVQVALNLPPFDHRPGGHHLDGVPPAPDGRPETFTLLAGVLLSDQPDEDAGNLWVWPGTHLTHEAFFREHGPDALVASGGYPPIPLPAPEQVRGRAGDLLLAHFMLGHNIGGNTSGTTRRTLYYRLKRRGHADRWREFLQDALLDFDPVRAAVTG